MIGKVDKRGFIYIETIITVVILLTTLVSIYSIYSKVITKEKERLYYDDISKIYISLAIRDILSDTIDDTKFNNLLATDNSYITFFDYNSNIFHNQDMFQKARTIYNIERFAYIKIADIPTIKTCIKNNTTTGKCGRSLKNITYYGTKDIKDYILTIDVPNNTGFKDHTGILITIIKQTKSGAEKLDDGTYQECLQEQVFSYYNVPSSANAQTKKNNMNKYYNDKTISFNMICENTEYLTWVFI